MAGCHLFMERVMGFEPTTFCLGSKHSTPELHPLVGGEIVPATYRIDNLWQVEQEQSSGCPVWLWIVGSVTTRAKTGEDCVAGWGAGAARGLGVAVFRPRLGVSRGEPYPISSLSAAIRSDGLKFFIKQSMASRKKRIIRRPLLVTFLA